MLTQPVLSSVWLYYVMEHVLCLHMDPNNLISRWGRMVYIRNSEWSVQEKDHGGGDGGFCWKWVLDWNGLSKCREVGQCSDSSAGRSRIPFVTCIPRVLGRVNRGSTTILASIQPWLTGERVSVSDSMLRSFWAGIGMRIHVEPLYDLCRGTSAMWRNKDDSQLFAAMQNSWTNQSLWQKIMQNNY